MYVVDGAHKGEKGDIVRSVTGNIVIRVGRKKYAVNKDLKRFKEISKNEQRTFGQLIICILLALTIVGIPIAALILLVWKKISWTAGCETNDGEKFIIHSDSKKEYNLSKKYFGTGAALDF